MIDIMCFKGGLGISLRREVKILNVLYIVI